MQKYIKALIFLYPLFLLSCQNNKTENTGHNKVSKVDTGIKINPGNISSDIPAKKDDPIKQILDSAANKMKAQIKKEQLKSPDYIRTITKIRNLQSFAQYLNTYFSIGFTESEVAKVQGLPESKVTTGKGTETWFYEKCEVNFREGKVESILNENDCLHYLDLREGIQSDDELINVKSIDYFTRHSMMEK